MSGVILVFSLLDFTHNALRLSPSVTPRIDASSFIRSPVGDGHGGSLPGDFWTLSVFIVTTNGLKAFGLSAYKSSSRAGSNHFAKLMAMDDPFGRRNGASKELPKIISSALALTRKRPCTSMENLSGYRSKYLDDDAAALLTPV